MKKWAHILLYGGAFIIFGALVAFILQTKTQQIGVRLLIGYFYAFVVLGALGIVHRIVIPKINVFTPLQQWLIRSLLYAMAVSGAFMAGYIFQMLILLPPDRLQNLLAEQLLTGFLTLVSAPFTHNSPKPILTRDLQAILISFFSVIFFIGLVSAIAGYVEVRWREVQQKQTVQQAELMALRAQIEPHFLFNSLNTITSLVRTDPPRAERLLIQLSNIFRYLFKHASRESVSLKQEIEFTRQYVELLQARFGDRLQVEWQLSDISENTTVPALLFQPLIENAVRHGWQNREHPFHIQIQIKRSSDGLVFKVMDDGAGIRPEKLKKLPLPEHALENIANRLALLYSKNNLLSIKSEVGKGTAITITIPEI